ncbi:MAG: hypothetical protein KDB02_09845 [Acidimicrobiales bacterium]|nr:hypothetical protein [Acidimicrobiales bacterium]
MGTSASVAIASRDETAREILVRIVEAQGHRPVTVDISASSLGDLLAAAPTLVLLDLDADAPDVVKAIRGHADPLVASRRIVVLANGPAVGLRAWQTGTDAFLARPFHHDRLVATLSDVLERPEAGRESVRQAAIIEYQGRQVDA